MSNLSNEIFPELERIKIKAESNSPLTADELCTLLLAALLEEEGE